MKTMNFFKAAMISLAAMVMTVNAADAASNNNASMMEVASVSSTYYVNTSNYERVNAHSTDQYRQRFYAGETVYVYVNGDGDTDLDLYIYDDNGNLVDSDTDLGDTCLGIFTPRRTGYFTIRVKNLGNVYNRYYLRVVQ